MCLVPCGAMGNGKIKQNVCSRNEFSRQQRSVTCKENIVDTFFKIRAATNRLSRYTLISECLLMGRWRFSDVSPNARSFHSMISIQSMTNFGHGRFKEERPPLFLALHLYSYSTVKWKNLKCSEDFVSRCHLAIVESAHPSISYVDDDDNMTKEQFWVVFILEGVPTAQTNAIARNTQIKIDNTSSSNVPTGYI